MKLARLTLALIAGFAPAILHAQRPTVSDAVERLLGRDTVVTVWMFGRPDVGLTDLENLVVRLGGTVRRRSKWLHAVSADVPTAGLRAASQRPELRHLQPVARFIGRRFPPVPVSRRLAAPAAGLDSTFGDGAMPLRRLNLFPLVARGLTGVGVTVAVLDTGFETELPAFSATTVLGQYDFVFNDSIVRNEPQDSSTASRHGTQVWSLLAANLPNEIIGIAPDADYLLAKTEDIRSETRTEEDNYVAALEWADSLGADIISSSLAYFSFDDGFSYQPNQLNGDIAVTTIAADSAAARGIAVVTSVGNSGSGGFRTLATPADGDSVIAVGAEDSLGVLQTFSSKGPTADGRLKPDLTAPGRDVFVVDPVASTGFARVAGTSFSAPLIAGTLALMRETHPTLTPIDLLGALRGSATNRANPDSSSGWGRPDGAAATTYPRGVVVVDPPDSLMTSVTPRFEWDVPDVPFAATPVTYEVIVARDTTLATVLLDTVVTEPAVTLLDPQRPAARLAIQITVVSSDTVRFDAPVAGPFVVPAWTELITFNNPAGITIRDARPTFRWSSLAVAEPPGPFRYDVEVIRADRGTVEAQGEDLTVREFTPEEELERNTPYRWRVTTSLGQDSVVTESEGTFLILDESIPTVTLLFQNFPNPFPDPVSLQTSTCIWFDLARGGRVHVDVLDVRGHVVQRLFPTDGQPAELPAGRYGRPSVNQSGQCDPQFEWDGTARNGTKLPRGIYLVKLATPAGVFFKRVVYLGSDF